MPAPSTRQAEGCSSSRASRTSGAPATKPRERPSGQSNRQGCRRSAETAPGVLRERGRRNGWNRSTTATTSRWKAPPRARVERPTMNQKAPRASIALSARQRKQRRVDRTTTCRLRHSKPSRGCRRRCCETRAASWDSAPSQLSPARLRPYVHRRRPASPSVWSNLSGAAAGSHWSRCCNGERTPLFTSRLSPTAGSGTALTEVGGRGRGAPPDIRAQAQGGGPPKSLLSAAAEPWPGLVVLLIIETTAADRRQCRTSRPSMLRCT